MVGWIISIVAVGAAVAAFWMYLKAKAADFKSLIVLLREPRLVTPEHVKRAAESANLHFTDMEGQHPIHIKHPHVEFYLGSHPTHYAFGNYTKENVAQRIRDLVMQEAYLEHRAWFSTAIEKIPDGSTPEQAYAVLGRLIAELLDDTCLIVWSAEDNRMNLITPELVELFREGRPLEALIAQRGNEVSAIKSDDERMKKATDEARQRWPEFVAAFQSNPVPGDYIVKFPFTDGDHTEHMWVSVEGIQGDEVSGTLMNAPFKLRGMKEGQPVSRNYGELSDWCYLCDGKSFGAFSEAIVRGG